MKCGRCGIEMVPIRLGGFTTVYICKNCEPEVYRLHFCSKEEISVWVWLRMPKEEFERQVLYGSCVKCGQTARSKDSCLCINHTRSYHSWQTRMSKHEK